MRRLLASLAVALATAAAPLGAAAQSAMPNLLTIITSDDPQTQLMALVLTNASMQKGSDVRILLCGPAGDIALREPPKPAMEPLKPRGMSPQGLMVRLMESGVTVEVCAIYLPNLGAGPEVLLEGVGTAMPPAIADAMLDPETRIFSF
jgi:hypothetical protein